MNTIKSYALLLLLLLIMVPLNLLAQSDIIPEKLIPFELKDQFDKQYTHNTFTNKYLIVFGADKKGSDYSDAWRDAVTESIKTINVDKNIICTDIADLRGIPSFLKGFVKGKFPEEKGEWALMDWEGIFAQAYKFTPDVLNILIFNQEQILVLHVTAKELNQKSLEKIINKLKSM